MKKSGFTLIELSIVLVIIGLLIGGIIAGKELIRSSELNSVVAEYQGYRIALVNFRAKYDAIPGDMANATTFWGAEPAANCPGDQTTPSLGTATCNGNGDNYITYSGAAGKGGEVHRFWQHLANAGMISGQYTGTHSAGGCNGDGSCNMTLGVNTPASKLRGAAWTDASQAWLSASTPYYFAGEYGLVLFFGQLSAYASTPALTPAEAAGIDRKIDDGKPGVGYVRSWVSTFAPNCSDSTVADVANYKVDYDNIACPLIFRL